MKIVIDTSVIISVITNESYKQKLVRVTEGADLISPSSLHWEIGNAFSAMFKRGKLNLEKAKLAIAEYRKIPIQFYDTSLDLALECSKKYDLCAYDAYFLICAKNVKAPFLSLDQPLIKKAKEMGVSVIEV